MEYFMHPQLSKQDIAILDLLQADATLSTTKIAEMVGMSQAPCWRRIQKLKDDGYIRNQVCLIDRHMIGLNAQVFALVKLSANGRADVSAFSEMIREFPEVLDCFVLMGSVDFILRIVTKDVEAYERFYFDKLSRVPGVQEVNSMVALSEIKHTTKLPLC